MKLILALALATLFIQTPVEAKGNRKPNAKTTKHTAKSENSLYKRLGGTQAITAVVDQFVANCAGDARIASFFSGTAADAGRMSRFKKTLVEQFCMATGGPCKYTGKDMKSAHFGMGIKNEHFDALVEDLTSALNQFKVPTNEQGDLLKILGPMRGDVVETKS